jgi:hypothetical protein
MQTLKQTVMTRLTMVAIVLVGITLGFTYMAKKPPSFPDWPSFVFLGISAVCCLLIKHSVTDKKCDLTK